MKALLPKVIHCPHTLPSHQQQHHRPKLHLDISGKNHKLVSTKPVRQVGSSSTRGGKPTNNNTNNNVSSSGGGGGGGGGFGNNVSPYDGWEDSSSFSSPSTSLVASSDDSDEEKLWPVRSFCCMNVGPVFDGSEWRTFNEERHEELWRPCLLPCYVQAEIMWELVSRAGVTKSMVAGVKEQVEEWYRSQGYNMARVVGFSGLEKGLLCCRINEGTVTDVRVAFRSSDGKNTGGMTCKDVIARALPFAVTEGMPYNKSAVKEALQRIRQLNLFEKVNVELGKNELGGVSIQFLVQERMQDGCNFQSGLSFFSSESGRPILTSVRPAATLSVEHRNICGMNRTLRGYIHTGDLLGPQDDSRFKLVYIHPYVDGLLDMRNRVFRLGCYNSRRLTAVFSHATDERQVPALWVDRAGLKANMTEKFSERSKLSYGFVLEEVATRDGAGSIQTFPDEFSGGIEHVPFFQAKITRNNTCLVNGSRIGAVDTFQLDQGIGVGTKTTFFNKHQLSATRFLPLQLKHGSQDPLPLAIVRARYGGILGDIPTYRAFPSLRGTTELGRCTSFLELMSEVRLPVWSNYLYGYAESFTELDGVLYHGQSLRSLLKNAAGGTLLGVGVKTGDFRTEFVFDCSSRTGSLNVQMGDRI